MKRKTIAILIAIVAMAVAGMFAGCINNSEYKTHTNSNYGFSIEYPKDWEVDDSGGSVQFGGKIDYYITAVTIIIQEIPSSITVQEYAKTVELGIKGAVPYYHLEEKYNTTIEGEPAVVMVYTCIFEEAKPLVFKQKNIIFIKDGIGYSLSSFSLEEIYDKADKMYFEKIMQSFRFTSRQTQSTKMKTYENSEYNFSIEYPEDWDTEEGTDYSLMAERGVGGIYHRIVSFSSPNEFDMVMMSIDGVRLVRGDISLQELVEENVKTIEENPSFYVEKEYTATIDKEPAAVVVSNLVDGSFIYTSKSVIFKKNGIIYTITCSAPQGIYDEADAKYFEEILQSFRFHW
ncbi:MAG: hypothetical protein KAW47_00315 [Thermoplasmatales archaeon]|nr:hypothetical protein [Thermoplasmatales archaeon]